MKIHARSSMYRPRSTVHTDATVSIIIDEEGISCWRRCSALTRKVQEHYEEGAMDKIWGRYEPVSRKVQFKTQRLEGVTYDDFRGRCIQQQIVGSAI